MRVQTGFVCKFDNGTRMSGSLDCVLSREMRRRRCGFEGYEGRCGRRHRSRGLEDRRIRWIFRG